MTDIHPTEFFELGLDVEPAREAVIVRPVGEIDIANVHHLEQEVQELLDRGFDALVLDLRGLTFIDGRGIRLVYELSLRLGRRLTVRPGPPAVQRAFQVAGVSAAIPFAAARRRFVRLDHH